VSEQRPSQVYETGQWQIDLGRRELLARGVAVPIGARAFEIVEILVRSANELVTKNDLMNRIWPGATVGENTLQVHISAIRKALGQDRAMLKTASGRGYRLLGNWTPRQQGSTAQPAASPPMREGGAAPANNFPLIAGRLIGRAAAARHVRDLVSAYRVVTLTGPGGIGKTSLAIEAARGAVADFDGGGWFVELASLPDPGLVPSTVASVLGLKLSGEISAESIAHAVGTKHLLLVLDNCEHVIDAAANLAERFVRLCPNTTVLVTSREILRIDGEAVYRVPPLDVPALGQQTPDHILGHSAVELFITRMNALDVDFSPRAEELTSVAAICRRLDGLPLAIEFAAASAASLGIASVAIGLRDRFALLTGGRRTALARHRTLRATLDWGHELLPEAEQRLFRRLAVFHGGFTLDAAVAVMTDTGLDVAAVMDGVANLVTKSLVVMDATQGATRWYLLETTRAYALDKLDESGDREWLARRHAGYFRDLFARAETELKTRPAAEWRADYLRQIDDLRAALDWAFSANGDAPAGVALTAAAVPLWVQLSLMEECRDRVRQALTARTSGVHLDARIEMILHAALGASLTYLTGPVPETVAAWLRTSRLAEDLEDTEYRLRGLRGLWSYRMNVGEYPAALALADEFHDLAERRADRATVRAGNRMSALILHYLGEQAAARERIESIAQTSVATSPAPPTAWLMVDPDVAAPALLARILWLQGFPDQATRTAEIAVRRARSADHTISMCHALAQAACPVALWTGDLLAAEGFVATLADLASRHALGGWIARAQCFEGALLISQGQVTRGAAIIQSAVPRMGAAGSVAEAPAFLAVLAHGRGLARQWESGLAAIEEALERSETTGERWCAAELLRIKGELLLSPDAPDRSSAEEYFHRALEQARRQGALGWELRAATSRARLLHDQDGSSDAKLVLQTVYDRFTEGFETIDLRAARALLDSLPK
jgi:predicted ATPase/DNA-binding winged helix-turn-helix (wHTH) protein